MWGNVTVGQVLWLAVLMDVVDQHLNNFDTELVVMSQWYEMLCAFSIVFEDAIKMGEAVKH